MADLDFDLPYREVGVPGTSIKLRVGGLDFHTMVYVFKEYGSELDALFQRYAAEAKSPELDMGMMIGLGTNLAESVPDLAALVILKCSGFPDNPENRSKFRRLPFTSQMEAIESIMVLTFEGEDGPKKAVEAVIRAFRVARGLIVDLRTSPIGSMVGGGR